MKVRLILLCIFSIFSANIFSQEKNEIVQSDTLSDNAEKIHFYIKDVSGKLVAKDSNDYCILEYKDKTAAELYTNVLAAISVLYNNPERVLSKVENVSITVSGRAIDVPVPKEDRLINDVFPSKYRYYGFDYVLSFLFKDGKIKVNSPTFSADRVLYASEFDGGKYDIVTSRFAGLHFPNPDDEITIWFEKYINNLIISILEKSETVNNW